MEHPNHPHPPIVRFASKFVGNNGMLNKMIVRCGISKKKEEITIRSLATEYLTYAAPVGEQADRET